METILLIFGGKSTEYEVSLCSAASVLRNIPKERYNVLKLGITSDGRWLFFDGDIEDIENNSWHESENSTPAIISPDAKEQELILLQGDKVSRLKYDVIFPVLHGKYGEDGIIQGLFELADKPYVGCDLISSAICMDKIFTNTLADALNIRQARWIDVWDCDYLAAPEKFEEKVASYIGFPCFVKPANTGSSVGISKVKNSEELPAAIKDALIHDRKILVEEGINGYEVECAVLGNDEPIASVVGQIIPSNEFYDYEAKYINNTSELIIPAKISKENTAEVQESSVKIFHAMGCSGLSRVDFFVGRQDGLVYFNEINTLPGFTAISMYPKLFEHLGISYSELLDRLIVLAFERYRREC